MSDAREQRNEVFRGAGVDPRMPQQSIAEQVKNDFGIEMLTETVPLPSNGVVYPTDSPLHLCETVDIKAMTTQEENILMSKTFIKKGTVISELIKACLLDKRIDPRKLLTGDRNALMTAIRITGYGAEYDVEMQCSECDVKAPHQFDLSTLPIKRLKIEPIIPGMNMFECVLPICKKTVRFKFATGRDEEEAVATAEKQKKLGINTEQTVTTSLFNSIISVDGIEDRAKLASFVSMIPARDSLFLRTYIFDNEPGIVMKQETTCPACGHVEEVNMPMGVSFLWPSAK